MAQNTDPTLAAMKRAGTPLTLENYLHWAYLGNPPSKLDPEQEEQLPAQFRSQLERERQKAAKPEKTKA